MKTETSVVFMVRVLSGFPPPICSYRYWERKLDIEDLSPEGKRAFEVLSRECCRIYDLDPETLKAPE